MGRAKWDAMLENTDLSMVYALVPEYWFIWELFVAMVLFWVLDMSLYAVFNEKVVLMKVNNKMDRTGGLIIWKVTG